MTINDRRVISYFTLLQFKFRLYEFTIIDLKKILILNCFQFKIMLYGNFKNADRWFIQFVHSFQRSAILKLGYIGIFKTPITSVYHYLLLLAYINVYYLLLYESDFLPMIEVVDIVFLFLILLST